jgi:hypothetical protein
MASFSIAMTLPSCFLDEPPLRGGIRKCSFTMPAAAIKSSVSLSEASSDNDMSILLKYALAAALRLLLPIYKDSGNRGQYPQHRQLHRKLRDRRTYLRAQMVEQVVGSYVPRAPRLYAAAHWRWQWCCRLTRLASGEMWWQLPRPLLLRRRWLAFKILFLALENFFSLSLIQQAG